MKNIMKLIDGKMPVSSPESQGISSLSIIKFMEEIRARDIELQSFQLVRGGKLIASAVGAPFTMDSYHRIFSAAKGIVATAILLAVQEGRFELDTLAISLLPKKHIPENLNEKWNRLTVYHLLTMTTGHAEDALFKMRFSKEWIKCFFELEPQYEPGTFFVYDMGAQYVMNEIIREQTGQDLGSYVNDRVFRPLGIEYTNNFTDPEGIFYSSTIQLHPDGLTKLGILYLQEGEWEGKQIIRRDLAKLAGQCHRPSYQEQAGVKSPDGNAGYALHMWRNSFGGFRFDGGQGQTSVIIPEYDMVFSTLAGDDKHLRIFEVFSETILRQSFLNSLPENSEAYSAMLDKTQNFNLAPEGSDCSGTASKVSGKTYVFEHNAEGQKRISFNFETEEVIIRTQSDKGLREYRCGLRGAWKKNTGYILLAKPDGEISDLDRNFFYDEKETLLSGAWIGSDCFEFRLRSPAMICSYRFICTFKDGKLEIISKSTAHNPQKKGEGMGRASLIMEKGLTAKQA